MTDAAVAPRPHVATRRHHAARTHATSRPPRRTACRTVPRARLVVLVPAHDEEAALPTVLRAVRDQTYRPAHVVVVADRCTDGTAAVARAHGAHVLTTRDNADRKAGALNQSLAVLVDAPPDYVMVLDADTVIGPRFVETALSRLDADPRLGAASGIFLGPGAHGWLQRCQANEYTRYAAKIGSTGRVSVVTGTASVFRYAALRDVACARGSALPGRAGDVYDRGAITEDSELTLALRTRGWRLVAPPACVCRTELMPSTVALHRQRVRWYTGMLDNLRAYGLTRVTAGYHLQQLMLTVGTLTLWVLLALTVGAALLGTLAWQPFWLAVGAVFVVERLVTVWEGGSTARWISLLVLPELVYDLVLQRAYLHAWSYHLRGRSPQWGHLTVAHDRPCVGTAATGAARGEEE
ncbi:glycosyltransferase family 2 protein [Cellulomonas phragmiteti]|nr:glycosyltransferase family 2 protein [Cellulomonas phragmiteti]